MDMDKTLRISRADCDQDTVCLDRNGRRTRARRAAAPAAREFASEPADDDYPGLHLERRSHVDRRQFPQNRPTWAERRSLVDRRVPDPHAPWIAWERVAWTIAITLLLFLAGAGARASLNLHRGTVARPQPQIAPVQPRQAAPRSPAPNARRANLCPVCNSAVGSNAPWVLETPSRRYAFDTFECFQTFYQMNADTPGTAHQASPAVSRWQPAPRSSAATRPSPPNKAAARPTPVAAAVHAETPASATTAETTPVPPARRKKSAAPRPAQDEQPPSVNEPYPFGHVTVPDESTPYREPNLRF